MFSGLLRQLRSKRNILIGHTERDFAGFIVKPGNQAFGHKRPDLFLWEVDDTDNQLPNQGLCLVQARELSAGLPDTDFLAVIDVENVG